MTWKQEAVVYASVIRLLLPAFYFKEAGVGFHSFTLGPVIDITQERLERILGTFWFAKLD